MDHPKIEVGKEIPAILIFPTVFSVLDRDERTDGQGRTWVRFLATGKKPHFIENVAATA